MIMIKNMRNKYLSGAILIFLVVSVVSGSELRLPSILGDHMVLQQNTTVNVWGWAAPGDPVEVITSWNEQSYTTTTNQQGEWLVKVQTGRAGGPYEITIQAATTIILKDILLGEVWICSGQSNMEWPLNKAESATSEIPRSLFPDLRLFTVDKRIASRPKEDVEGSWQRSTPLSARHFSAVGYFFGKYLHQQLKIPVGLIHTSWGGTPSQAWTSQETLRNYDYFHGDLEQLYGATASEMDLAVKKMDSLQMVIKRQSDFLNPGNIGLQEKWMQTEFDDSEWMTVSCPAEWSSIPEIGILEGVAWMRYRFQIPEAWTGKPLVIELGPIDEMDVTYLNGRKIGSSLRVDNWNKDRIYKIPGPIVTSNDCVLAIRIVNKVMQGGLFGQAEQLRIYPAGEADVPPVSLAGEWKFRKAYEFPKVPQLANPKTPTVLYNGMLYPLRNMTIKGAIWYQGEANVPKAFLYREIFPDMITDWRSTFGQGEFPFYFVQLAPYKYGGEYTSAELREAQFMTLSKLSNTGMAVTLDIGDPNDIHPVNKRDVGKRLALWAMAKDYGQETVYSGPLYNKQVIEGEKIRVFFKHTGSGLQSRGGDLTHFEIAGADQVYHPAAAVIEGETVVVNNPQVPKPVAVRYGWRNTAEPNLFNREGLPASSFCTDNWKRVTE